MLIKAFRLFVSSTFADFTQEREVLQSKVFPALDAYCAGKGYQFHAIDLRWGVNEEAQLDQRTAEICLGEVAAAKRYPSPNFLIMVGDRYGWVPLPFAIPEDVFEAATAWLAERGRAEDVGDLRKVYRLDENYLVPPGLITEDGGRGMIGAYTLRSREGDPELAASDAWEELENRLRGALQEAAGHLAREGRISEATRAKYVLSLTEQEIVHGLPGYKLPEGSGAQTASPAQPAGEGPQSIAWIREPVAPSLLKRALASGACTPAEAAVERVKSAIRRALPDDCILTGRARRSWSGHLADAYLGDFAARIERRLREAIDGHIAVIETQGRSPDAELLAERAQHHAFAEERRSIFQGRDNHLVAIAGYLASDRSHPLVLYGPSGLGKSALMAQAVAEAEISGRRVPIVSRFVGASATSADVRSLVISIVDDLVAHGVVARPEQWEGDAHKFDEQTRTLLKSIDRPVAIFIDALDQLKKPFRLGWLPDRLPPQVKFVVSVLDDAAYEEDSGAHLALRQRLPADAFLAIEPLPKPHARDTLVRLEARAHRSLRPVQRDYVLSRYEEAGASPLWLRVAFEIARGWRAWDDEPGQGRCVLASDTAALIAQLIAELSSVYHHERELVSRTLGLLVAAKDGLSAKEITQVLSRDSDVMAAISSERHGVQAARLPDSVWVRLNRQLAPLLVEKRVDEQPLLGFFHRQLADIARDRHYAPAKAALHGALAGYFDAGVEAGGTAHKDAGASGRTFARRSLSELPYQLFNAGRRARLDEILMAPDWMQQKLKDIGVRTLIDDFRYANTKAQRLTGQTLELSANVLAREPRQLVPQILGRLRADLADDPEAVNGLLRAGRAAVSPPALVPRWPSFTAPGGPEVRRFEDHGAVWAVAFSPDGRHVVSSSGDGTLRLWEVASGASRALGSHGRAVTAVTFSPDGRHVVSGSWDRTLRLWEVASGASRALQGHGGAVNAVAFSPDGRQLVSGSEDRTLRLWEVASGASRALQGHGDAVTAVAFSPDGRQLASGSYDRTLRLWEVASGASCALEGHGDAVTAVAFSPDGRQLVSGSYDRTLRLWEVVSGASRALEGHGDRVLAVAFSPDGRQLVSGSTDRTLRLWEVASGASRALGSHGDGVMAVAFSRDGRQLASGSFDRTLRLWEVKGGALRALEGHGDGVWAVAFSPDGRQLASGSYDRTVRLWEVASGASRALEGHGGRVRAVAFSPDGRQLVSASLDGTLRLWEVASGASRALQGHGGEVNAVAFSPDGRQLVSGSWDRTLLWEVASGASRALQGHGGAVTAVAFSPDGRQLVSGSTDGTLRLWEVASGASRALGSHGREVTAVAFSPDGRQLVSASFNGTVRLWEMASGVSRALEGHGDRVLAVAFSPDGRQLVSGSTDRTLRLWEVASGQEIARLDGDVPFLALHLAPNGKTLAAGDNGGRVHLIDILLDEADKAAWLAGHRG